MPPTKSDLPESPPIESTATLTLLKAYAEALRRRRERQADIDQLICDVLGLPADQPFDPATVPSAEEIRAEMARYIPFEEKLSDWITSIREE
ncbi:MAG: hypothetical protein D6759_15810 [Chloroflexi bacterium]|nr:MAG: hypothetical protein D6759_15810 [Chloroflexota bacterium]